MASSFQRLPAETVANVLAGLPAFRTSDAETLSAARADLARAIASGQDAGQLAGDLSTPGVWLGADLKTAAGLTPPASPQEFPQAMAGAAPSPAWAVAAAQAAVQAKSALRVAVLDRDPTGMSTLSLPVWAQGQQAVAAYGPLVLESAEAQLTFQKWLNIYIIPVQMVSFVQGSTTVFVAPLAATGSAKVVALAGGSVWVNVSSLASGAPANSYAGLAISGGTITSDEDLTLGATTVTIPAGATITLNLTPAAPVAGNPALKVAPPATITFTFPAVPPATASVVPFTSQIFGETFDLEANGQPLVYNDTLKTLAIPCSCKQKQFAPVTQAGTLAELTGSATLLITGWALRVTQAAPDLLGNATGPGIFYLGFSVGLSVHWTGLSRPEPEAGGIILASSEFLLLWTAAGLPPFVLSQQKFDLWDGHLTASTMTSTRVAGNGLVYEIFGAHEVIELGAVLSADLDRPLLADGSHAPVEIPGLLTISGLMGQLRLFAYGAFPASAIPGVEAAHPNGFPMALDNAMLKVSVPLLLVVEAKITAPKKAGPYVSTSGGLLVGFLYQIEFPFLPDPYTTGTPAERQDGQSRVGGLLGEVIWPNPDQVDLRMIDLGHAHPLQPPASEASSNLVEPLERLVTLNGGFQLGLDGAIATPASPPGFPFPLPAAPAVMLEAVAPKPQPIPVPVPALGLRMLDLSTRASLLGVEIIGYNFETAQEVLTIDGVSARTWAVLAPVITLPAISWEPMYNQSNPVAASPTDKLLYPPNDGPLCGVGVDSVTLVPVSPIQCLGAILEGTQAENSLYGAVLTLPFGLVAGIAQTVGPKAGPAPELTQPSFSVPGGSGNVSLTGAYQLTMRPPNANPNAPIFAGKTYTRTQNDNPPAPGLSYGEQVLGLDVGTIFFTQFNNPGEGVPLKRYDLTGYGASLFTDWTRLDPPDPTAIIQVDFNTTVGRTSHEVIQAQSVIYPWGIKVVRTITIDRLNSGSVERTDSGWIAASDGHFVVANPKGDFKPGDVQAGVIDSLLNVKNIQEFGVPLNTPGTFDWDPPTPPLDSGILSEPQTLPITLQPVTFDSDIAINPQHAVILGGSQVKGLDLKEHTAVPSTGIVGYIGLTALYHLSALDLLNFLASLPAGTAGGPIHATLNLGKSDNLFRCVGFSAAPAQDSTLNQRALVIAALGLPKLPQGSAWSVALQQNGDAAPHALPPTQPIPVIQPNDASGVPGTETHFADPSDIFRLAKSPPAAPQFLYGFLQDVATQKSFLAQPYVTSGDQHLSLRQTPSLADPGVLLGAVSSFPAIASALPLTGLDQLVSSLGSASLAIDKWFDTFPPPVPFSQSPPPQTKITHLINTSVATVDLVYRWRQPESDSPPAWTSPPLWPGGNAMIHVTLAQPTGPAWSIDIYQVALVLTLPGISSTPALWIEGAFHADSESLPSFPNLQVFYDGPLKPITQFFSTLQTLGQALGLSDPGSGGGLSTQFADGKLTIQETFNLGTLPLGPGEIQNISLDMGGSIDIPSLDVDYLVGIGSPDAPVHWIVDPMSGTGCLQAGVQSGSLAVLVQLGIGLGLAIDLAIASGSASIVIAFQVQITGSDFELMILLTGQAQIDVLGGLASCSITISVGLGLEFPLALSNPEDVTAIGTASVAVHLSICWIISIDWQGSWSFSHEFSVPT